MGRILGNQGCFLRLERWERDVKDQIRVKVKLFDNFLECGGNDEFHSHFQIITQKVSELKEHI